MVIGVHNALLDSLKHACQILHGALELQQRRIFDIFQHLHVLAIMLVLGRQLKLVGQIMQQNLERQHAVREVLLAAEGADEAGVVAADADQVQGLAFVGLYFAGQVA